MLGAPAAHCTARMATKLFRRILVPHDFSAPATRALAVAAQLARAHRGRLLVLHVVGPFHPATALPTEAPAWVPEPELIEGERRRLERIVSDTVGRRGGPPAECRIVIGDPFRRIADATRGVDSIVMATAGRTGLSHLLIGSVAEKVVRHARVPVLTVRGPTPARRRRGSSGRRTRPR
jgi:nucleotide-binding universal stress UspA family protein